jgi:enoyl-CoA hydratase/carnithine racemase
LIAQITLERPTVRNALRLKTWQELGQILDDIERSATVRAVVLTGAASWFCSGGDLRERPASGAGPFAPAARVAVAHGVLRRLRTLKQPTICAVEGGAVGLGWSLASSCTLLVCGSSVGFSAPFVTVGAVPDGGLTWLLQRTVGPQRAAELMLLGATLPATEALRLGLINRVADDGRALAAALEMAAALAASSPTATTLTTRLLRDAGEAGYDELLTSELAFATLAQLSPDAEEGRTAFRERRAPRY